MNRQATPSSADLDSTAELPTLPAASVQLNTADTLSFTDTWNNTAVRPGPPVAPPAANRRAPHLSAAAELATRTRELEAQLQRANDTLADRERRIEKLEQERSAALAERDFARTEIGALRDEAAALRSQLQMRPTEPAPPKESRATQTRRLRALESDIVEARANADRYRESLQDLENRRLLSEAVLADREASIREHEARIETLSNELAEQSRRAESREQELRTQLESQQQQARELDETLAHARAELQQLKHAVAEADARRAEQSSIASASEFVTQAQLIEQLREQLKAAGDALAHRDALITRLQVQATAAPEILGDTHEDLEPMAAHEPERMLVRTEGDTGIVHRLGRRTTIGRTPDNDMCIDAEFISRHHAVILVSGADTVLEDLNSTNGTYVNGERISRRPLNAGDLVILGKSEFRFVIKPSATHAI